jgi:hypothetical protein
MKRMGLLLEPRILEHAAVLGYRVIGEERLWIPRLMSSIFWVIGGVFVYVIAIKTSSWAAALFSAAFYLFLPFGITASRSFMPDPLMTMMLMFSIFKILQYYDQPSKLRFLFAAAISSLAIFIKPFSLFLILCAFISLAILRQRRRSSLVKVGLFVLLSLLPTAFYYVYGILSNTGFLQEQAQASFLPHLLLKTYFWEDWFAMIGHVTGYIPFICAGIGFFLIRNKLSKAMLSGLWIGYLIFGLFFTFHIHTHPYYHLQLIPVVALSLGPLSDKIFNSASILFSSKKRLLIIGIILLALIAGTGLNIRQVHLRKHKDNIKTLGLFIGINPEFHNIFKKYEREVRIAKDIGKIVEHSTNTVFLTTDYGRSLAYYGELSGLPWPTSFSLQGRKERGLKIPSKEEIFNRNYLIIRTHGKYIKYTPDFFIITNLEEFEKQKDLANFLNLNFPLKAQSEDYLIFDLRSMAEINR